MMIGTASTSTTEINVITNSLLLVRRLQELQNRRRSLREQADDMHRRLPIWAVEPLQKAGMTLGEIRDMTGDLTETRDDEMLADLEMQIDRLDAEIEAAEEALLQTTSKTFEGVKAVTELAVDRLRAITTTDPDDVLYDYGEARVLRLLERALEDMKQLEAGSLRNAS
ncbi:MAG: hypothetical protein ACFB6S_02830 [Geminicoccaceae bacterium]